MPEAQASWRFPRPFWMANVAELFERSAYYGVFIGLAVYLTRSYHFSDVGAGWLGAYFSSFIYLVPTVAGAWADRMGFRAALIMAFGLLATGYFLLGLFGIPDIHQAVGIGASQMAAVAALTFVMLGGAFVKPIISGSVARYSDPQNRARAFSIYYQVINIGAFLGKTFAHPLRVHLGLEYISFYSSIMALFGMAVVILFYRGSQTAGEHKTVRQILADFGQVLRNTRFMMLILVVAGFWVIQGQLYASMPKYVLRTVGNQANPEWLANINPAIVVIFVVPITHLVRRLRPVTSIGIALLIIPLSALTMSLSPVLRHFTGSSLSLAGIAFHPVTIMLILGIAFQGIAECFLSPKYLEFASKQAPPGQEGLYMGYSHLHTFIAWLLGFAASGYLLKAYCPNPQTLTETQRQAYHAAIASGGKLPATYAHAHYIWYIYASVGVASFLGLLLFRYVTDRIDARKGNGPKAGPSEADGQSKVAPQDEMKPQDRHGPNGQDDRPNAAHADSADAAKPESDHRPIFIDPHGSNPVLLHAVVMAKIVVFLVFLTALQGNAIDLITPYSIPFYVLIYLIVGIAADALGIVLAKADHLAQARRLYQVFGLATFPLGLFLILSSRLLAEEIGAEERAAATP